MTTIIQGDYIPPTATNLTQTVTRINANPFPITPIILNTSRNYNQIYTATFTITSTAAAQTGLTATLNGLPFTRVGNTYTLSSEYINDKGIKLNNWAYFKLALSTLSISADSSSIPNPPCTISTSITDGVTNLSGTISASSLAAATPTTPGTPTLTRNWDSNITVNWPASTQTFGPGIGGYYIYRNTSGVPYATILGSTTTYIDNTTSNTESYYYRIQAFDLSGIPLLSSISAVSSTALPLTTPTTPGKPTTIRNWNSNITLNWTSSSQTLGPGIGGYYVYRNDTLIATTSSLTYLDTDVINSGSYIYKIQAFDSCIVPNVSAFSATTTAPIASIPTTPTLSISGRNTSTATLTWTSSSQTTGPGVVAYEIYKGGTLYTTVASTFSSWSESINSQSQSYQIRAIDSTTSTPTVSALSNTVSIAYYIMTSDFSTGGNIYQSSDNSTWSTAISVPLANGTAWRPLIKDDKLLLYTNVGTTSVLLGNKTTGLLESKVASGIVAGVPGSRTLAVFRENNLYFACNQSASSAQTLTSYSTSSDGITWTSRNFPVASRGWMPSAVNGKFFLSIVDGISSPLYYASTNAINWTSYSMPFTTTDIIRISGGGGIYYSADSSGTIYFSSTGIGEWSALSLPSGAVGLEYIGSMYFSKSTFSNTLLYSTSGTSFNSKTINWSTPYTIDFPIYLNGKYWVIAGTEIASSTDGISWTINTMSGDIPPAIQFYSKGYYYSINGTTLFYSTDGINWNSSAHGLSNIIYSLSTLWDL